MGACFVAGETSSVIQTLQRFRSFRYVLILEGIAVGLLAGVVVVLFRLLLEQADVLLHAALSFGGIHPWFVPVWLAVLAGVALLVARLVKWEPNASGSGIPQVEGEMEGRLDQCWWRVLLSKITGGALAIGSGLSLGREGPSIQLGAMVAKGFSRLTKRIKTEERLLMTCGAAAGLSAAFNAPFAGVLFSLEEIHKNFSSEVLLSTMAASIAADCVSRYVFGLGPVFTFSVPQMLPLSQYGHVVVLGVLLGCLGVLYNRSIDLAQRLFQKIPSQPLRLLIPFLCAGALGFLLPDVLGGGHGLAMQVAVGGYALWMLCLLLAVKFVFSMASFGSGSPGGIFLPLLVLGALTGGIYVQAAGLVFPLSGEQTPNFVILGMAGLFSAIVRAPITGIVLISEMTGSFRHLLTLSLVSLAAYLIPDLLKIQPVYEQLLARLLEKQKQAGKRQNTGVKVLVDGVIHEGSAAVGKTVADIAWPETSLMVSLTRGNTEVVPNGSTVLRAGDRVVLLCDQTAVPDVHQTLEKQCMRLRQHSEESSA